ncbi:protocadherin Fat 3-like [Mya arenaria]|uniref:protocadherin Fat 3-like n=1 Tax=Mya arenaria TaxID=6604 RepID=UPI0022E5E257|nr:protocadherin Fat 3-like [Mya arenaria]
MDFYFNEIVIFLVIFIVYTNGQGPDCTGQVLGEPNPTTTGTTTGPNTDRSYVMRGASMKVPCCGVISEWRFATAAAGDLSAQVLRQDAGNSYTVMGENIYTGAVAGTATRYSIGTSAQVSVEQNFEIGWHSSSTDAVALETNAAYTMGAVNFAGKTAEGGTVALPNTLVNGERWMFGAVLSSNAVPHFGTSLPATKTISSTSAAATVVHSLTPTDDNPDDIAALTVTLSPASTMFDLVGNDVQVLSTPLAVGEYDVVFEVVDHCLHTGTATLTVTVVETGPIITSLPIAAVSLREDASASVSLHQLVFTDDGPLSDVSCSIQSTDPAGTVPFTLRFADNTADYTVFYDPTPGAALNYDLIPLYSLFIVCNDGQSDSAVKELQISITPNEPPVPDIPAKITVSAATTNAGDLVHTVTATDPENDKMNFTMDCGGCPFIMLKNGEIHATENLNSHRTSPYVATINVTDPYNNVGPTSMTIEIIDINTPPTLVQPTEVLPDYDQISVAEHTDEGDPNPVGTVTSVFTASGSDADGDPLVYEMEFVNGQGEQLYDFDPDTGEIFTKVDLDFEELSRQGLLTTYVNIRTFDGREYSEYRQLEITVTDVNETPTFNQVRYAIETVEGASSPLTLECPLFDVTDEDNYDTRQYDIDCGGIGYFHIPGTTKLTCDAFIQQTAEHDLDGSNRAAFDVVTCTITVYDKEGLSATTTLEITIHEEDDNPPVLDKTAYTYSITNDTTAGAMFGNVDATDIDVLPEHRRHTYTTDSSEFGIDENGVFVSKVDWTGVLAPTSRTFNVYVKDEAGHTDVSPVTVTITDVPPTTTAATTTTVLPANFNNISSFLDDTGNLAWLIPAVILGALMLGLLGYMCFRCCANPALCASLCRGRCFGGGKGFRRARAAPRTVVRRAAPPTRTVVRRVEPVKMVRRVESVQMVRRAVTPVKVVKQPLPETPKKESSSMFDCFKRKPKPPEVKTADGNRSWHLWNHTDFKQQDKWVG